MMRAVAQIDAEILSAPDPLPNATIRFFLRAAEGMGKGWVSGGVIRWNGVLWRAVLRCGTICLVGKWLKGECRRVPCCCAVVVVSLAQCCCRVATQQPAKANYVRYTPRSR